MSDRDRRRFDFMQSESCWCQFPSQLYFPVVICACVSFFGNPKSLKTRVTFERSNSTAGSP